MAAVNFPNPAATNPETNAPYRDGWYNPDNGVTYVYVDAENAWKAATVNNANFDDIYVNEVGGDHMEGPLTIGPDTDPANAVIKIGSTALGDGDIQVGGDATAQAGVNIYDTGAIISTASSNTEIFRGYLTGGTGDTVEIRSTGDATFAGDVEVGGDVQMASQNGGPLAGFRNVLINGNLTINQRNLDIASVATGEYGQDRWKKTAGGMTQIIEAGNFEPGATYTLSGTGITTQQLTAPASGNWTLPDVPVTARKIQLEPGPVATPFEHRPIGTELALCQRYYQTVGQLYMYTYTQDSGAATRRRYEVPRTVVMRGVPTEAGTANNANASGIDFGGHADRIYAAVTNTDASNSTRIFDYTADAEL